MHSPYKVHAAYIAFSLYKLNISPKQLFGKITDLDSFLEIANNLIIEVQVSSKQKFIQVDDEAMRILEEISDAWRNQKYGITNRVDNILTVNFSTKK